eukprot:4182825-Prorocentrum_lima.AAC.1
MTSSLVGSEMCIRDSPIDQCTTNKTAMSYQCSALPLKVNVAVGLDVDNGCLLYTSDAADDM